MDTRNPPRAPTDDITPEAWLRRAHSLAEGPFEKLTDAQREFWLREYELLRSSKARIFLDVASFAPLASLSSLADTIAAIIGKQTPSEIRAQQNAKATTLLALLAEREAVVLSSGARGQKQQRRAKPKSKGFEGLGKKKDDYSELFDNAHLTPRQRECASLRWEHHLKIVEIAGRLSIHHSTVGECLRKAEAKMDSNREFQRAQKAREAHRVSHDS